MTGRPGGVLKGRPCASGWWLRRYGGNAPALGPGLEGALGGGVHGPGVGGNELVQGSLESLDVGVGQAAGRRG